MIERILIGHDGFDGPQEVFDAACGAVHSRT
jgi:hypothetical protein